MNTVASHEEQLLERLQKQIESGNAPGRDTEEYEQAVELVIRKDREDLWEMLDPATDSKRMRSMLLSGAKKIFATTTGITTVLAVRIENDNEGPLIVHVDMIEVLAQDCKENGTYDGLRFIGLQFGSEEDGKKFSALCS